MKEKKQLSFAERLKQLDTALRAIKYANNNYIKTKDEAYLLDLMGRLRALLCSGGKNMTPLLLSLMNEANISLYIYSWAPESLALAKDSTYSVVIGKTWQIFEYPSYKKYLFQDWLNEPFYFSEVDKKYLSRNELLKKIANTQGGSHYEIKIPFIIDKLARVQINNKSIAKTMVEHVLLDVAMATAWAGEKFINTAVINDLERQNNNSIEISKAKQRIASWDQEFDEMDKHKPRGAIFLGNSKEGFLTPQHS